MVRLAVYSFASVMDVILSSVLFVCMVRMADMKASATAVASLMTVWAIAYMISSLMAGRFVTRGNAGWILIASCVVCAGLSAGYVLMPGVTAMYALGVVQGCATAFFFTPFQVFIKLVDENRNKGIAHSTGLYTFSWSMGYALGPFIAGFLWENTGWKGCHLFNGVLAVVLAVGMWRLKHLADASPDQPATVPAATDRYADMPDLAWMAWVFGGLGCAIMSLIRSVFPSSAAAYVISKPEQGTALMILCTMQALVGLGLGRGRWWMYRPRSILTFGLFGVVGLGLFAVARNPSMYFIAAACYGIYSGSFYYYFVFHSLVHPTRAARYVSVNEAIVGLASIAGPFIGGAIADRCGIWTPYLVATGVLAVAIMVQAAIHRRHGLMPPADLGADDHTPQTTSVLGD